MRVLAIGDCGIDRYVDARVDRPGGISLNFAANARACFAPGDRIGVLTALGDDREAGIVERAIDGLGLDATIARRPGITPVQYIDRDADGERRFVRYEAGVLAEHRLTAGDRATIMGAGVMIATVFTQILDFFDGVAEAPSGGLRALDYCNLGTKDDPLAYVRRYAGRFDVGFFGLAPSSASLIDALEGLARATRTLFVVTLGSGGSVALDGSKRVARPAVSVSRVVDTTGAGDTFAAGFLGAYAHRRDVGRALEAGAAAAARTLGHMGAFEAEPIPWPADAPAEWTARRAR